MHRSDFRSSGKREGLRIYFLPFGITFLLLLLGAWLGEIRVAQRDHANRNDLKQRAVEIASALDKEAVRQLAFDDSDLENPAYQQLCRQLRAYAAYSGDRSIFTMALKGNSIVFGPESLDPSDPFASPPGTVYQEPSDFDWEALREGKAAVKGVYTDEYGNFVGANAPVIDPATGNVLIVLGIDRLADEWAADVAVQRYLPWTGALLLTVLTWLAFGLVQWTGRRKMKSGRFRDRLPVAIAGTSGLIVSVWLGLSAWEMEYLQHRERLQALALQHQLLLNHKLADLQDQFSGLYRILESGVRPEDTVYQVWREVMSHSGAVSRLEWVPTLEGLAGGGEKADLLVLQKGIVRNGREEGYLLMELDMQRFMVQAFFSSGSGVGHIELELHDVSEAGSSGLLARYSPGIAESSGTDPASGHSHEMPLFPFGKSYILKARPAAAFYPANPVHSGWLTFFSCALGTLAVCFLIHSNRRKEAVLEGRIHQFTHAVEQSPVLILITDTQGRIEYVNPKFESVTGYSFAEVQGRSPSLLKSGTQSQSFYRDLWSSLKEGREWKGRFHNRRKNGELYWEQAVISPVRDPYGTVTHYIAVKEDVTERKQVEEALQESEARFRALFELSPFGVSLNALDGGGFLEVNREMEKVTGYSCAELRGMDYWKLTPKEYDEEEKKQLILLKESGRYGPYEKEFIRKNGSRCPVLLNGVIIKNTAGRSLIWSIVQDITEQKKSKAEIRYQSYFQRLLMDLGARLINVSVEAVDSAIDQALADIGKFTGVDRAYMFRYDFDKKQARNTHEWCAPTVRPEISNQQEVAFGVLGRWVDSHSRGESVYISRTKNLPVTDPLRSWLEQQDIRSLITVPMMEKSGCLGFVGFDAVRVEREWSDNEIRLLRALAELLTNAEMRRRHDNELILARDAAQAAARAKSEFLANMSHEIRTPMNGVIGMTGLLMETSLTEEQRGFAEIVRSSGESLLQVINDILDFSKIESGKMKLEHADFDLQALIGDLTELLSILAKKKKIRLEFFIEPEVPLKLKGDPGRLRQILINLLGNAVKFTDSGEVALRVSVCTEDAEKRAEGKIRIRFEIKDTGIGIPPERRGNLFQPFSQIDSSSMRRHGGTGLGLAICRQLVELFDGKIGVESNGEKGSCFWFTAFFEIASAGNKVLPDRNAEQETVVAPAVGPIRASVLLAEDNQVNQRVTGAMLHKLGCTFDIVSNGLKALKALEEKDYDLILMDCQMPEMDGYEATRAIRSGKGKIRNSDILIIALTANAIVGDREKCLEAGMNDYLSKPVKPAVLAAMLRSHLDKS